MRALAVTVVLIFASVPIRAWDVYSHQQIVIAADDLIAATQPNRFLELDLYEYAILDGVLHEDDGINSLQHFYNPRTTRTRFLLFPSPGLYFGYRIGSYDSALQFGDGITQAQSRSSTSVSFRQATWSGAGWPVPMGGAAGGKIQAPTGLTPTAVYSTSATWSWTDNASNALGYRFYESTHPTGSFTLLASSTTLGPSANSYTETGLTSGDTYYAYVAAVNAGGVVTSSGAVLGGSPIHQLQTLAKRPALGFGADPTFELHEVYAFPNPSKRSQRPTIHVETGLADSVDIHFYDVSGRKVHSVTLTEQPSLIDDKSGRGPQYAYEYTWEDNNVGSGVYIYVVTTHKAGHDNLTRINKVAIIK